MNMDVRPWFDTHIDHTESDDAFRISIDVFQPQEYRPSPASPMAGLSEDAHAMTFMASNLSPSLYAAAENAQSIVWQDVFAANNGVPSSEEDDFDLPTMAAPNSFLDRILRLEQDQGENYHEKFPGYFEEDSHQASRVDSAIGDLDDTISVHLEDIYSDAIAHSAQLGDPAHESMVPPYHLLRTRSTLAVNGSFLGARVSDDTLQAPESSHPDEDDKSLSCDLCDHKPFTGVHSPRNLARHRDQVHAPCTSPTGIRTFHCSVEGCDRTFRRADARLIHERRSHPELKRPPPVRRKRSGES